MALKVVDAGGCLEFSRPSNGVLNESVTLPFLHVRQSQQFVVTLGVAVATSLLVPG